MTVKRSAAWVQSYVEVEETICRFDRPPERIWAMRLAAMSFSATMSVCRGRAPGRPNGKPYLEICREGAAAGTAVWGCERRAHMRARMRTRARTHARADRRESVKARGNSEQNVRAACQVFTRSPPTFI